MSKITAKLHEARELLGRLRAALEETERLMAQEGREEPGLNKLLEAIERWEHLLGRIQRMEAFRGQGIDQEGS